MSSNDATIDAALKNLEAIKSGEASSASESSGGALSAARREVSRLYNEHQELRIHLPEAHLHVGVARWKSRNGVCKYNHRLTSHTFGQRVTGFDKSRGHHAIVINERIWKQGNESEFLDTVRHEVAHAIAYEKWGRQSQKHNKNWKVMARKLGADDSACHTKHETDKPYTFGCPNGCWESGKSRRSKKIKKPWSRGRYCSDCGATPASCDSHKDITNCEPGEVAVDSIGWSNKEEYRGQ